ncbi:universal stress protein [Phaeobacter sp. B1627]|uniref:universal stress protein n=1 Tax=Phaeobacter sp. B1627 TaxID=2583809 RepID=UPI00111ABFA6|nr:universal stress protein [Phaeobacter sp. B1627]TNJ41790.1 universal stress protein [Phaeobacter sp. B1627]
MFQKIVVPVDLAHEAALGRTLQVAADLARTHKAALCFVGVASSTPGVVARTPEEYDAKLKVFAASQAAQHGVPASGHAIISHDPAVDLNKALEKAIRDLGADLVVMATHMPNVSDYIWAGHGAHVAAHSPASVLLVRDQEPTK